MGLGTLPSMVSPIGPAAALLSRYQAQGVDESADVRAVLALLEVQEDPWSQALPLHLTSSALVVHPPTGRILLRWHQRIHAWLQIGGHGDPGERNPIEVALREGREETGLPDLTPWPAADLVHVVVVPVPANSVSPAHRHADLRFVLATRTPELARAERPDAPVRWLTAVQASAATSESNLRETISRVRRRFAG